MTRKNQWFAARHCMLLFGNWSVLYLFYVECAGSMRPRLLMVFFSFRTFVLFFLSLFLCFSYFYLSVWLFVYLSVYLPVWLAFFLSVCLSVCGWESGFLSVCLVFCLSICLSFYLSVCLSVCLAFCLYSRFSQVMWSNLKIVTIQWIKSRIWDTINEWYINKLAKLCCFSFTQIYRALFVPSEG